MKHVLFRPLVFTAVLILFTGLACQAVRGAASTNKPAPVIETKAPSDLSTAEKPKPTSVPPTEIPPTETPRPLQAGDLLYATTFQDLADWEAFTKYDLDRYTIESRSDGAYLRIPESSDNAYLYYYLGDLANDVRIEADVELIGGTNYTYITLVCRESSKGGYYFFLDAGGFWQIGKWDYEAKEYSQLAYGGSTKIKVAKALNHLTAVCQSDTLTFSINGSEVGSARDPEPLTGEYIGVGVETLDLPLAEVLIRTYEVYIP